MKRFLHVTFVMFVVMGFSMFQGCQMQDEYTSPTIEGVEMSSEFEDFIVASVELYQAYVQFEKGLTKINFNSLETRTDTQGNHVKYLPATLQNLDIEQKALNLNRKKASLFNKFPELQRIDENMFKQYVDDCIQKSQRVNDLFLSYGINIFLPSSRFNVNERYYYDSMEELQGHIYNWVSDDNEEYVEVVVFFFADGTSCVYRDSGNTDCSANYSLDTIVGDDSGKYYKYGKEVVGVGHSHQYGTTPSTADKTAKSTYPNIDHYIYYDGAFYSY